MRKRKYSTLAPHDLEGFKWNLEGTPLPTVHNIVATSQIGSVGLSASGALDLHRIHEMLPFSFYDQQKFAAITVRLHNPNCTTLLFSSGKLVVTGCRTWYECVYASLFVADLLSECLPGHVFRLNACDVQNMVAHVEIPVGPGGSLDLHAMYAQLALNCTYQRKMFPGLIYRPEASPVVLLCFFSGKVVITGGKTMDDVFSGWNMLWPTLKRFIVAAASPEPGPLPEAPEQGLALDGDPAADDARRRGDGLVQVAGGGGGGQERLDLPDPPVLQRLGDDLAAERAPPEAGRAVAAGADERLGEPGAPHAPVVEPEMLGADAPAEFEAHVILLGGDSEAHEAVVGIAQVLGAEAGGLAPHDGETLVQALEEYLGVAKRMLARPRGEAVRPVIGLCRHQERDRQDFLVHDRHAAARENTGEAHGTAV
jgi:transcription initiation factor TFIID TATA-box-binding protein